jgi:ribosomal protein L11 methyltransferase
MAVWRRLTFRNASSVEDDLAVVLHEQGCLGTEARGEVMLAWFDAAADPAAIAEAVAREPELAGVSLEHSGEEPDGAWHERWMAGLAPIPAGSRFLIVPGPTLPPDPGDRTVIRLTPGRAFGTGEHTTTRMCLELLEPHAAEGVSVIDVGTGSGVLAIAAWMLGCRPVTGLDIDAEAVGVAARNARLNGCAGAQGIRLVAGPLEAIAARPADLVLANLTAATLTRLLPDLARRTRRAAIFSGILLEEEADISGAAAAEGLHVAVRRAQGDWCALDLRRRDV